MSDTTSPWQGRIQAAEAAVEGSEPALASLPDVVDGMRRDDRLLSTPADASEASYFLSLLRELGQTAEPAYHRAERHISRWVRDRLVPEEYLCVVGNRIGTVLAESGHHDAALQALHAAQEAAHTPLETAYTLAQLALLEARIGSWTEAREHAAQVLELVGNDGSAVWLDVRMWVDRALFVADFGSGQLDLRRARDHMRVLVEVCGQQIERWGSDHPRALEALMVMAEAQHAEAWTRSDAVEMERLTDVLAVVAQRSATLLGARHPQARAARSALLQAHQATEDVREEHERRDREQEHERQQERERARERARSARNDAPPWPQAPPSGAAGEGAVGEATSAFTSPLGTTVMDSDFSTPHDPFASLRELVTQARFVLWDFDGPICRLFAGHASERVVATDLVDWLATQGLRGLLTDEETAAHDPYVVLRAVERKHPHSDLVAELAERLTLAELKAVPSAMPTAYADPLIRTWQAVGTRLAITTNVSTRAAQDYLRNRGLESCFAPHIYGRTQDMQLLKPNPHTLNRALNAMGAAPNRALMIGDSPADVAAASGAGVRFLGYARNERKETLLRQAGALSIVTSLEQVLQILRS
jgi:phosphoglycolate phosphatase-like HAD superfamily hydrolase/tetratricopeptide (TPR) repeat protein